MKSRIICLILSLTVLVALTSCNLGSIPSGTNPPSDNSSQSCTHTEFQIIRGYDATCTETGLTDGKECVSCGEIIQTQNVIGIKSHSYDDTEDKVCNFCGFLNSELPTFIISESMASAGDKKIALTLSVKNNPGIASIILSLVYDNTALELTEIEYNTEIGGQTVYPQELESPVTLYWINGFADTTGDWILATLYFDILEGVTDEYEIQLSYNPDNVYNIAEENLDFEVIHGKIVVD